jgi:hypothetical protein
MSSATVFAAEDSSGEDEVVRLAFVSPDDGKLELVPALGLFGVLVTIDRSCFDHGWNKMPVPWIH